MDYRENQECNNTQGVLEIRENNNFRPTIGCDKFLSETLTVNTTEEKIIQGL